MAGGATPMATSLKAANPNTPQNMRATPLGQGKGTPVHDATTWGAPFGPSATEPPKARGRRSPIASTARQQALVRVATRSRTNTTGPIMPQPSANLGRNLPAHGTMSAIKASDGRNTPAATGKPGGGAKRVIGYGAGNQPGPRPTLPGTTGGYPGTARNGR